MKEIIKILKEHFILLLGAGVFTYGLFSFDAGAFHAGESSPFGKQYAVSTFYHYSTESLILLTVGIIFITIGILEIRKTKSEN